MAMMYPGLPGVYAPPPPPPPPRALGPLLPRHGEPGWTMWPRGIWPIDPLASAPRRLLVPAAVAGLIGTALWRPSVLSLGYLLVGLMVFGVVFGTADRRPTRVEGVGIVLTLALLAVPGCWPQSGSGVCASWRPGLSAGAHSPAVGPGPRSSPVRSSRGCWQDG